MGAIRETKKTIICFFLPVTVFLLKKRSIILYIKTTTNDNISDGTKVFTRAIIKKGSLIINLKYIAPFDVFKTKQITEIKLKHKKGIKNHKNSLNFFITTHFLSIIILSYLQIHFNGLFVPIIAQA